MPGQKRIRGHDAGKARQAFSTDRPALRGQSATLIVVETGPPAQLLPENADLLLEVFNNELLSVIHPTSKANQ